jgi:acyl-CoA reductase-like NAD-dependent aldehyde dehydrogenase
VQRVIVDQGIRDEFLQRFTQAVGQLRLGDPLDPETDLGPVINPEARDRIREWIDEAEAAGADRLDGGQQQDGHLAPVVLTDVDTDVRVWQREVFGPVVSVRTFRDLPEAITLANGTEYGLQAGIFTRDLATALTAAEQLEFGGVTINQAPTFRADQMPYGGTKESGNTREGPHNTVREMTEERMIVIRT